MTCLVVNKTLDLFDQGINGFLGYFPAYYPHKIVLFLSYFYQILKANILNQVPYHYRVISDFLYSTENFLSDNEWKRNQKSV